MNLIRTARWGLPGEPDDLQHVVFALKEQLRWRDATKEFPPNTEPVLICLGSGEVVVGYSFNSGVKKWYNLATGLSVNAQLWVPIPARPSK